MDVSNSRRLLLSPGLIRLAPPFRRWRGAPYHLLQFLMACGGKVEIHTNIRSLVISFDKSHLCQLQTRVCEIYSLFQ